MPPIEQKFTAMCGHEASSMMDNPTPHKMAVRRQYWRKTACKNCRHTGDTIPTTVLARCGHEATAQLRDDPTMKSSPAQRTASARQYWKSHDCPACYAQTPIKHCTRETFKCGHEDWLDPIFVTVINSPGMEKRYGPQSIQAARAALDLRCYACEDKDNPCLPTPTHRIVTYTCGHKETLAEPVMTYYLKEHCSTCLGYDEPPAPPASAIISTRRPKAVVRAENAQKILEARRREHAGLPGWPLPDDWKTNPTPWPERLR